MDTSAVTYGNHYVQNYKGKASNSAKQEVTSSFQSEVNTASQSAAKKEYPSAVEDWKKRHPDSADQVEKQVQIGRKVLARNGAENVDRERMSMEEYKEFFTRLMNSIPYDASQQRDVNVWTITQKGWEQMKNDPDYEAWVLGYTAQDRSFHNPWASLPGYSPRYHTERFGASIQEHLGQSFAMNPAMGMNRESWWEKRHKTAKKLAKQQEERGQQEAIARRKAQEARWQQEGARLSLQQHYLLSGKNINLSAFSSAAQVVQAYEMSTAFFSSVVSHGGAR